MYYEIYKDVSGFWRWRYISSNGRIIADSAESYVHKSDCLNGVGIMQNSYNSPVYEQ